MKEASDLLLDDVEGFLQQGNPALLHTDLIEKYNRLWHAHLYLLRATRGMLERLRKVENGQLDAAPLGGPGSISQETIRGEQEEP